MLNFFIGFLVGLISMSAYFVYRVSRNLNRRAKSAQWYVDKLKEKS